MSDVANNNNSTEGEEKSKVETPATTTTTTTAADVPAVSEPTPAEGTEVNATSESTSQPAIADTEQENKPTEESMEVEESKPETEVVQNKETTDDASLNHTAPASQESGDNEAAMSSIESKSAGGDNSVTTTVSNDSKIKTESKEKRLNKVDLSKAPVRQYLDATVVPILLGALSAVARERPANPVEFLGTYLLEKSKEFHAD